MLLANIARRNRKERGGPARRELATLPGFESHFAVNPALVVTCGREFGRKKAASSGVSPPRVCGDPHGRDLQ